LLTALTVEHKLQAFSPDYFGTTPVSSALFTYAHEWECQVPVAAPSIITALPPPRLEGPVSLQQLATFLQHPVRTFYRERLHLSLDLEDVTSEDQEPFSLNALDEWHLQDELIQTRLDAWTRGDNGQEVTDRQLARIQRRGDLPLGHMAELARASLTEPLEPMFELYANAREAWPHAWEDAMFEHVCEVQGQPVRVQGLITQRVGQSEHESTASPPWHRIELHSSHLIKDHRYRHDKLLHAWVLHLAAHVSGCAISTQVIGKIGQATLPPLDIAWARQQFDTLIQWYVRGLCYPLPLAVKTGFAWLNQGGIRIQGPLDTCTHKAVNSARAVYEPGYRSEGEAKQSPYLHHAYPTFERLWSAGEFTHLCDVLYAPLRDHVGKPEADE
jgi:exodeoxyribonuclease V gamma subunit